MSRTAQIVNTPVSYALYIRVSFRCFRCCCSLCSPSPAVFQRAGSFEVGSCFSLLPNSSPLVKGGDRLPCGSVTAHICDIAPVAAQASAARTRLQLLCKVVRRPWRWRRRLHLFPPCGLISYVRARRRHARSDIAGSPSAHANREERDKKARTRFRPPPGQRSSSP